MLGSTYIFTEHEAQEKKGVGLDFVWGSLMTLLASQYLC